VAKSIVNAIRVQTPGGRFLQKDHELNVWNDIGDQKATEKTSQALREGAPDIRTEMEQEYLNPTAVAQRAENDLLGEGAGGYNNPKPGKILSNGLITLDYEGVLSAREKGGRGPLQDGTIDINHPVLPTSNAEVPSAAQQVAANQPLDPMMQAFQQFQAGLMTAQAQQQQQQPPNPFQAPQPQPTTSTDPVSAFAKFLNSTPAEQNVHAPTQINGASSVKPEEQPSESADLQWSHHQHHPELNSDCSKLPLPLRNSGNPGTQPPTGSILNNADSPQSNNNLMYTTLNDISQAQAHAPPTTIRRGTSLTVPAVAPAMSREMALQILLGETAQKAHQAREDAAEAQLKTLQSIQQSLASSSGVNSLAGLPRIADLPQGSSSLLAEYLAAVPSPLPLLGNVSSMSDEQIRQMLATLKSQSQVATGLSDSFNLVGQMRGPSLSGVLGSGGVSLSNPLGSNSLQRLPSLGSPADIDNYASQYADMLSGSQQPRQPPPNSSLTSTIASRTASIGRTDSIGLQQAIQDAMRYLGPINLEAAESLGPTPLRPGVSAALAQMKMAEIYRQGAHNNENGNAAGAPTPSVASSIRDANRRVFCVPPVVAAKNNYGGGMPVATFKNGAALYENIKMTSAPQRGLSGNSLDNLCRAAGLCTSPEENSAVSVGVSRPPSNVDPLGDNSSSWGYSKQDGGATDNEKQLQGKSSVSPEPSRASGKKNSGANMLSKKMKMLQGLMDSKQQVCKRRASPQNRWASVELENAKKQQVAALKNSGCVMGGGGLKPGKNDQSLMDDSDDEETAVHFSAPSKRPAPPVPAASQQSKRRARHSFENNEPQRPAKQHTTTTTNFSSNGQTTNDRVVFTKFEEKRTNGILENSSQNIPRRDILNRGVSFSRDVRALPITETNLDTGHSLAMSEISLDRGQSNISGTAGLFGSGGPGGGGGEDDGQFDDASDEEGQKEIGGKAAMQRGLTIGTVHTFSSAFGR